MRSALAILFLLWAVLVSFAEATNYYDPQTADYHCIVCGKGPLTGQVWRYPWGMVCDDCEQLKDRCSICGLPIRDGDGHIKTPDGRFICRFDKTNVVLTLDQAQDLFDQTRQDVLDLYGRRFALKYPGVTVSLFDVDYWSEKQGANGLHKYGFASTRTASDGRCTHEVVMLSGRTREEMISVAAHEYTHLWINENRPDSHVIDSDTTEAICELTAYKLMQAKKLPDMMQRILDNPYTNGKIKTLVEAEREAGTDYVLDWVINGKDATLDADANLPSVSGPPPEPVFYAAAVRPAGLKFSGIMAFGSDRQAVINGQGFAVGDQKIIKLHGRSVTVRCQAIHDADVVIQINGPTRSLTLQKGKEVLLP